MATKGFILVFIIGLSCNDVNHTDNGGRKEDEDRGPVKKHYNQMPQDQGFVTTSRMLPSGKVAPKQLQRSHSAETKRKSIVQTILNVKDKAEFEITTSYVLRHNIDRQPFRLSTLTLRMEDVPEKEQEKQQAEKAKAC